MTAGMRRNLMSVALLAITTMDVMGWYPRMKDAFGCLGGVLAVVYLVLAGVLWSGGVRQAGHGFFRWLFLTAFAAPMVAFGLGLADLPRDMRDGFRDGYQEGAGLSNHAAEGRPAHLPTPTRHWVAWLALTALLAAVLDRLERSRAEGERQQELARTARSEVLRGKLAPHFIFNALNTLHAQIAGDPKGAEATTERLADLFRKVLEVSEQPLVPLKQELTFVEAYLGIEKARLGDRLAVSFQVMEDAESARIPPLSLQVLVENAIKHGVAPLESGGEVRIGAECQVGSVCIWVEDPGSGFSSFRGTGTALETLRQRLDGAEGVEMGMVEGRHRVSFRWRQP